MSLLKFIHKILLFIQDRLPIIQFITHKQYKFINDKKFNHNRNLSHINFTIFTKNLKLSFMFYVPEYQG